MTGPGWTALAAEHATLHRWLFDRALPFWAGPGTDVAHGGFFERFSSAGQPIEEPRRTRLVARQIYVFATAGRLGWPGPATALVRHGLAFFRDHCLRPDGLVLAAVRPDGTVLRGEFDLYDHAFALFGLAAAAASGEAPAELGAIAARMRDAMLAGWAHPLGGFEEARPPRLPLQSNPHMHLLEAALAWQAISADPAWARLADGIALLALRHFIDPETGALREYFDSDWRPLAAPEQAVVEPGHQFEWAWLLTRWGLDRAPHADRADALAAAQRLRALAERHGVDPARRLAVNTLNPDLTWRDPLARLWPQTERVKAQLIAATTAPDPAAADAAAALAAEALHGIGRFLAHPVAGAWWEHIGPDNQPIEEPTRASSLYHITCALAEVDAALAPRPQP